MTETEWLTSGDPEAMLSFLEAELKAARTKAGRRKLRLYGAACARSVVEELSKKNELAARREVIGVAELYADGLADKNHLFQARIGAGPLRELVEDRPQAVRISTRWYWVGRFVEHNRLRAQVLRELFGNPYRRNLAKPGVLTQSIIALASAAYENRLMPRGELDPLRLGVLADALEEEGAPVELVDHLRTPELHWRGCWVLDLVLARA